MISWWCNTAIVGYTGPNNHLNLFIKSEQCVCPAYFFYKYFTSGRRNMSGTKSGHIPLPLLQLWHICFSAEIQIIFWSVWLQSYWTNNVVQVWGWWAGQPAAGAPGRGRCEWQLRGGAAPGAGPPPQAGRVPVGGLVPQRPPTRPRQGHSQGRREKENRFEQSTTWSQHDWAMRQTLRK